MAASRREDRKLARIYEAFPLFCPKCGGEMRPAESTLWVRIIAFIVDAVAVRGILAQLGETTSPPRLTSTRGPPLRQMADAGQDEFGPEAQPAQDCEFDQRIAW